MAAKGGRGARPGRGGRLPTDERPGAERPASAPIATADRSAADASSSVTGIADSRRPTTGVLVVDARAPGYPITHVSAGFEALTGYTAAEAVGRGCGFLQGPGTDAGTVAEMSAALAEGREAHVTQLNYRADGTSFHNEVSIAPEHDGEGRVVRFIGVQRDVTAQLEAQERIRRLRFSDVLTGLANRTTLQRELRARAGEPGAAAQGLAMLVIDLDDFERVNERHGHEVGDGLLRAVADRLRSAVRPEDLLARHGGDEFTVLARPHHHDDVHAMAARVLAALHEPFGAGRGTVSVRASVGASVLGVDASDAGELMRHAEAALRIAKRAGKNRFHVQARRSRRTAPDPDPSFAPGAHLAELDRILRGELVEAVYQPIVRLADRSVVAFEALARGPLGSPLQRPDHLFAVAGVAGRTVELDWLCRVAAVRGALAAELGRAASLLVNVEPVALDTPCPAALSTDWEQAGEQLDLVVEITERAVTSRPAELHHAADRLRQEAKGLALDDVGADSRSLALLPLLQPDLVKLDLRLVQGRPSTEQAAIVGAVTAESERTGAAVLAEGIETEEHARVARTLGAGYGQGWLFGRPGPLPTGHPATTGLPRGRRPRPSTAASPFALVATARPMAEATKALLLPMSHHLEHQLLAIGEGAVLLSAFQHARNLTPATLRRYETFARTASLVGALGVGLGARPLDGVHGAEIPDGDALAGEWSVVVVGPHFAGALVAADLGDTGPDRDRRFRFAVVYERELVLAAARTLLARLAPEGVAAADALLAARA